MNRRHAHPLSGFTLVELLVSISIMLLLLIMAWGSYEAATQSVEQCGMRLDRSRQTRLLTTRMSEELRCAFIPEAEGSDALLPATTTRLAPPPDFEGSRRRAEFLRFLTTAGVPAPGEPTNGVYRVAYRFDAAHGILLRQQALHPAPEGDRADWLPVGFDIAEMVVSFFDGKEWTDTWDSAERGGLPRAARIVLTPPGKEAIPVGTMVGLGPRYVAKEVVVRERTGGMR